MREVDTFRLAERAVSSRGEPSRAARDGLMTRTGVSGGICVWACRRRAGGGRAGRSASFSARQGRTDPRRKQGERTTRHPLVTAASRPPAGEKASRVSPGGVPIFPRSSPFSASSRESEEKCRFGLPLGVLPLCRLLSRRQQTSSRSGTSHL